MGGGMTRCRTSTAVVIAILAFVVPSLSLTDSPAGGATESSPGLVLGLTTGKLSTTVTELGRAPALVNGFYDFFDLGTGAPEAFPSAWASNVIGVGATPMVTWRPNLPTQDHISVLTNIADGTYDGYITTWAEAAKSLNHHVYVRLMHEFNGSWFPWGAVVAGKTMLPDDTGTYPYSNTPSMYVAAYQHVVRIFQSVGATNVEFVWCAATSASTSSLASYYPGDSSVAWASMDGYNRSTTTPISMQTIFGPGYATITSFTTKPILIAETASVEFSGLSGDPSSKAAWISEGYLNAIPALFPQVRGVSYFDAPGAFGTYPFDSSAASLQAMREVAQSPLYQAPAP